MAKSPPPLGTVMREDYEAVQAERDKVIEAVEEAWRERDDAIVHADAVRRASLVAVAERDQALAALREMREALERIANEGDGPFLSEIEAIDLARSVLSNQEKP